MEAKQQVQQPATNAMRDVEELYTLLHGAIDDLRERGERIVARLPAEAPEALKDFARLSVLRAGLSQLVDAIKL